MDSSSSSELTVKPAPSVAQTIVAPLRQLAVWGPGILVMLADSDAGNVITAAQSGSQWGYRLLPLLLLLIPGLYMVQELTVRLGIFTGHGQGTLIRKHLGPVWAWLSLANLALAVTGTLVTDLTGIAGVGEMYGVSHGVSLGLAVGAILLVVITGSYRRTERAALVIGLFELAFFIVAWKSHPDAATVLTQAVDIPFGNSGFLYLAAALVGAVFNPWMVFYQQAAVVEKGLLPEDHRSERWDTAIGAVLTQLLTAAVLVAAATLLQGSSSGLTSVGDISDALAPALGYDIAKPVFAAGVLGAAMVAIIVASLSLAWGFGEVTGRERQTKPFYIVYALCLCTAALVVGFSGDLVRLIIAAQALNAFLLPMVLGCLLLLARKALPEPVRLRGWGWGAALAGSAIIILLGLTGGVAGLLSLGGS